MRIDTYRSSEKEHVEITYLSINQNMFVPWNTWCSMKEEFYEQMNWEKIAKSESILKTEKVCYHFKAPKKILPL